MSYYSYVCGFIVLQARNPQSQQIALADALREIASLPVSSDNDSWPFLTSAMFSYTRSPEYRDAVIHFAASYKDILDSWKEWSEKFESLLSRLSIEKVKVVVEDEYLGDFIATWRVEQIHGSELRTKDLRYVDCREIPGDLQRLTNLPAQW